MVIAVTGSKRFYNYELLESVLDSLEDITMIVSGGAEGTDSLAKRYAVQKNIRFLEYPPDYRHFGNLAKQIRDRLVVNECDLLLAFWDKRCAGTAYTMAQARKLNKSLRVILI